MREKVHQQPSLVPAAIKHEHADELRQMSDILDALPQAVELVHADVVAPGTTPNKGRKGMTAEQILRALVIKQMNGFSYDELAFHLADSNSYRWFCRLGIDDDGPKKSTLQKAIKRVQPETCEKNNRMIVDYAMNRGIESGDKVRSDCTVVETNIHHPTDSSLLWDCVRVLTRLMGDAQETFGINFSDHSRRAKRRSIGISNAKSDADRLPLYRDLLKVADKTLGQVEPVAKLLDAFVSPDLELMMKAQGIAGQLRHFARLTGTVISQTERRILRGESVPATEKLVSIFEPHTDIIVKDRRETLYGHKICLTTGASGLVTDVVVEHGNPADSTLAIKMVERHREVFGSVPRQIAFDGGFASRDNLTQLKALGVKDVAFSKGRGLEITEMAKSSWVYRRLRDFRAGVEGVISFLKRGFDLTRCRWSGFASFKAYVSASVFSCNLLIAARHLIRASA